VKSLDERRSKCTSISSLFGADLTASRDRIVLLIESILLEDFEAIGKKTREILWRKVYYDPISTSKKLWKKSGTDLSVEDTLNLLNFIKNAIRHYKTLVLKFEDVFNLDLRYIIDFRIIASGADAFEKKAEKEIYTVNETNHALETIYSFLICLGDLHRYCIEFKFVESDVLMDKTLASSYYNEAFKLNPKNGMSHNQLGTLLGGENYNIEAIFHYLYSLTSPIPAELSEANISRIFQQNVEALEHSESASNEFNVKEFIQQIILVIDIFFFDKEISEFNTLCYSVLFNFKEYLVKCRRNSHTDLTFLLTSIFMVCLMKLKVNNSPKIQSLNAFLVAFCAEIVDRTLIQFDEFISERKNEDAEFKEKYNQKFHEFDKKVRNARDRYRNKLIEKPKEKDSGVEKNGSGSSNSLKGGSSSNHMSGTLSEASLSQPGQIKIKKRPQTQEKEKKEKPKNERSSTPVSNHNKRRRKRRGISGSSSESETESLFSENVDLESMNSDFDSYDEDEDYVGMQFSSSDGDNYDSDEDFIIENEELIVNKNNNNGGENDENELKFRDNEDVLIEEETIIFQENQLDEETLKLLKMKYKRKYNKVDPNIILEFSERYNSWMQSLKVLFNWLRLNNEILLDCYRSNPEFVAKIMKLINHINIDLFTRKIYFDRSLITFKNIRENFRSLFDLRLSIATTEDITFKKFILFEELQQTINWNLNYELQITAEEDIALRDFHIIDFGFYLCKQKKFNYSFCARSREFIEKQSRRRDECRGRDRGFNNRTERNGEPRRRNRRNNRRRDRKHRNSGPVHDEFDRLPIKGHSQESQHEEFPSLQQTTQSTRKGYLRDKNESEKKIMEDKSEMMNKMGKLWLKNEVQTLESRSRPSNTNLTPFLMLDTLALVDYLYIVKHLIKSKKFVVLIPKAGE
jgi:protein SMG5